MWSLLLLFLNCDCVPDQLFILSLDALVCLQNKPHLTSDYASLEVRERKDEIWQTLYGKAAWQLCLQPLGWMVAKKSPRLQSKSFSGGPWWTWTSPAQKREVAFMTQCCHKWQDSSERFQKYTWFSLLLGCKERAKNGNPTGAWKHEVGEFVFLPHTNLNWTPLATVLNCAQERTERRIRVCGSWCCGTGMEGKNQGPQGYFQPWLALFFLLVEMGSGAWHLS